MVSQRSNRDTLTALFLEQRDQLAARLARFLLRPDDIEDILQETFIQVWSIDEERQITTPQGYLYAIARNLIFRKNRAASKALFREIEGIDDRHFVANDPDLDDSLHHKRAFFAFVKAADSLPPQCRKVFLMRKILGLSQKQIAKHLSISTSTVERHITNALKRCHDDMTREGYNVRGGVDGSARAGQSAQSGLGTDKKQ